MERLTCLKKEEENEIVKLILDKTFKYHEIADNYNVSVGTISKIAKMHNIIRRPGRTKEAMTKNKAQTTSEETQLDKIQKIITNPDVHEDILETLSEKLEAITKTLEECRKIRHGALKTADVMTEHIDKLSNQRADLRASIQSIQIMRKQKKEEKFGASPKMKLIPYNNTNNTIIETIQ